MIPDYTLIRSPKRRRSVAVHIEADGALRVLAPMRTSLSWIHDFLAQKARWIESRRAALKTRIRAPRIVWQDGAALPFMGKSIRLFLKTHPQDTGTTHCFDEEKDTLLVGLPEGLAFAPAQEEIRTEVILWYKKRARQVFPERVEYWARQTGLEPKRLMVTSPQKRWGSCSADNVIRLNWQLIMAPVDLLDYVIVHELAHIRHKNHGKAFWAYVQKVMPDAQERRKALRTIKGDFGLVL